MKSKNCHTLGTAPKSNKKIIEGGQIDTQNTHIYITTLSWLGTDTSIKCGCVKLVLSV